MKQLEIERKFLLPPCSMKRFLKKNRIRYEKVPIEQFYISSSEANAERYRRIGDRYIHTRKKGGGLVREEYEEPVSVEEYEKMKRQNIAHIIEKVRYRFDMDGHTFELDTFKGSLKGLNMLEVEFNDEASAQAFEMPPLLKPIVLDEVTENFAFTNGAISQSMRIPSAPHPLKELLGAVEERKDFFKASTDVPVTPFESMEHAIKALIYSLTRSVEANREAMLGGDEDPERLHQLRVAMRKMRALFSQLGDFFDEAWLKMHKNQLAQLMRQTSSKRDIDVYLAHIDRYKKMVPKHYHKGIYHLQEYLLGLSKEENGRLLKLLQSETFRLEIDALKRFSCDESDNYLSKMAKEPVLVAIKPILKRRYKKVLKKGKKLDEKSSAHAYHLLRIDVKKLRYLMEFFTTVFEPEAYARMLRQLKAIQSILGDHQDLEVQRMHLKSFLEQPSLQKDRAIEEAIDALRKEMKRLEGLKRHEFIKTFKTFTKTKKEIREMVCRF